LSNFLGTEKMKLIKILFLGTTIVLSPIFTANAADIGNIGIPAKGGYPEYLFLDKVPKKDAHNTVE
jgi:hypothetical protein